MSEKGLIFMKRFYSADPDTHKNKILEELKM